MNNDRITDEQWAVIRCYFPEENAVVSKLGRKPVSARKILEAVLWLLNNGSQWADLPQKYPPYQTVHRRLQSWCQNDVLRDALYDLVLQLRNKGILAERESFIDGMLSPGKAEGDRVGKTKQEED